ncbi:GNAT family N-acetyltransferase [Rhodopirellula bahusiensis]|uniref:GNAT family N-acetyltransferase n=2 Tax=Rhodopirellula bahusiensis TaxID=2014065 RepID=A0A2G1W4N2_9BACT|nr:GNAT family N-acetyltransferase [Rhodopirellula bahusiensis]
MKSPTIRTMRLADCAAVVELNEAVVSVTSSMDSVRFAELFELSEIELIVELEGSVVGFLLAMVEGCGYDNGNYAWFEERLRNFLYIDRVVVSGECRGLGVGRSLYSHLFEEADRLGSLHVCAEMDLEPPNEASLRFHLGMGFVPIGTRVLESGKTVSMQLRSVAQ